MTAVVPPAAAVLPHPNTFDTKDRFLWSNFLVLTGMHLGALAVFVFRILPWVIPRFVPGIVRLFTSNPLATFETVSTNKLFVLSVVCLMGPIVGVTVAYHRGETHEAFTWDKPWQVPVRILFLALGQMGIQGNVIDWLVRHLPHHAYTDTPADSHSPMRFTRMNRRGVLVPSLKGLLWSHIGTYFYEHLLPPPPSVKHRAEAWAMTQEQRYESWAGKHEKDPILRAMRSRHVSAPLIILRFAIPFAIAGWDGLLIAGLFTAVVMLNITWCTNSVAHVFGTFFDDAKSLKIAGKARNVFFWLLMWIVSLGESWHDNHHRLDTCAAHGWKWYQIDFTKYIIFLLQVLGLVSKVQWARPQRANIQAGSHIARRATAPPVATAPTSN